MSELYLLPVLGAFVIFAIRAWRKHVNAKDTWVQRSFDQFMREEKARRVEKG